MKRRKFLKTTAVSSGVLTLNPASVLGNTASGSTLFFGVHEFIETHPEAVFIMRTDVDKKTNAPAILSVGEEFASSVLVQKNEQDPGAVPVSHRIAIKPNLTLRFNWDEHYTVEGTMGIVTDVNFVEGIVRVMKGLGINSDRFHIIETNYDEEDLTNGGYLDMVDRMDIQLKDLFGGIGQIDESDIVWKEVQNGGYFRKIPYIFPVNAPDSWLLNIAKFKAHFMGITGCAKNLQGTVVRKYQQHCKTHASGDLEGMPEEHRVKDALEKIAQSYQRHKDIIPRWDHPTQGLDMETWVTRCLDNNSAITAGLHVIEGVYGRDGHFVAGPSQGDNDPSGLATDYMTNIILFGKNPFHVDIIAHWLAGHEPGNFGLFHMALERGLSTKLNPMDIPLYEWSRDSTATLKPLTDFERTPLKSNYLRRNYNGQNEPYWHLCTESYEYPATSVKKHSGSSDGSLLNQNYPNPFNTHTNIAFYLLEPGHVRLEICGLDGRLVDVPVNGYLANGWHQLKWDGRNMSSGTYFLRLITQKGVRKTRKMQIVR